MNSRRSALVPKLVTSFQTYDRRQFSRDLLAGVVVAIVAGFIVSVERERTGEYPVGHS